MCGPRNMFTSVFKTKRNPNMPRNPTRSMMDKIHFLFKKDEREAIPGSGSRAGSRPGSTIPSRGPSR
uniref:Uncharacterized protein n=1 Tax=Physcomitrium patens TaxID=3218 RepID=A0A2K1IXQ9_PHYPA|nr:hypothetical protein PHYPA_023879 [Physcomitrium patens]